MDALLIIDIQNDFCPGGALEVPQGDAIIPTINRLSAHFDMVIQTQDWHPAGHSSFASSHDGKQPFEHIQMPYGKQTLWPDHCRQQTHGSQFHDQLDTQKTQLIIRKGFRPQIDSYSAFFENDGSTSTGLTGFLRERNITQLYMVGLATDFCVKWSALDGIKQGFAVNVVEDAVKGIDVEGSVAAAWDDMLQAGVGKPSSEHILDN